MKAISHLRSCCCTEYQHGCETTSALGRRLYREDSFCIPARGSVRAPPRWARWSFRWPQWRASRPVARPSCCWAPGERRVIVPSAGDSKGRLVHMWTVRAINEYIPVKNENRIKKDINYYRGTCTVFFNCKREWVHWGTHDSRGLHLWVGELQPGDWEHHLPRSNQEVLRDLQRHVHRVGLDVFSNTNGGRTLYTIRREKRSLRRWRRTWENKVDQPFQLRSDRSCQGYLSFRHERCFWISVILNLNLHYVTFSAFQYIKNGSELQRFSRINHAHPRVNPSRVLFVGALLSDDRYCRLKPLEGAHRKTCIVQV